RIDEQQVGAELEREQLHVLVGQRLRGGDHLAVLEQELDDVGRRAVELRAELLRRHAALDDDRPLGDRCVGGGVGLRLRLQLLAVATATPLRATRRTALTARAATGTTGPTRTAGARATTGAAVRATGAATGATGVAAGATTRT